MRLHVSNPTNAVLMRIGIPEEDIPAILATPASGKGSVALLSLIAAIAIIGIGAVLSTVQTSIAMNLQILRVAGRPLFFYADHWWSAFPLLPAIVFGICYAVHVLIRLRPELEENVTAASLQMQTPYSKGATGGLYEWMLRRAVICAIGMKNQDRSFLQRGNDCVKRVYLVLFIAFLFPAVWCVRNDLASFDLVTPDGVEYATWLNRENRAVPWRDVQQMTVECQSAGHGNYGLRFTIGIGSGAAAHRIAFSETFQPLHKFQRNGEVAINPATRDWLRKKIERLDALSSWQQNVSGQGVVIERRDGAQCAKTITEGLKDLPLYWLCSANL